MAITLSECLPQMAGARVMVTGGAGFIGSHLVDFLLQQGTEQVVVVDDLTRPRKDWVEARKNCQRVQFIGASILEVEKLVAALAGIDVVYHLAAVSRVMDAVRCPEQTFAVNVLGTVQIAEAARRASVRRLVFTSSREVYGDPVTLPVAEDTPLKPKNVYGASKVAAEAFLRTLDPKEIEAVILRLANVYGPGDTERVIPTFVANALQGVPLVLYGGEQVLDFIWVGDVVEVLAKAGFSSMPVLEPTNVGSGTGTRLRTLAQQILGLVNHRACIQIATPRAPEVQRFQADLTRANHCFGLLPQVDPLNRLPEVLVEFQS